MEALLDHGEGLLVPEEMIVAPAVEVFRPVGLAEDGGVEPGQTIGVVERAGTSVGVLVHPGERLREGQSSARLRVH